MTGIFELVQRARRVYQEEGPRVFLNRSKTHLDKSLSPQRKISSAAFNILFELSGREQLLQDFESIPYSKGSEVTVSYPDSHIDPIPDRLAEYSGDYYLDPPFVSVATNVDLVGPYALPIYKSNKVILEDFAGRKHKAEKQATESNLSIRDMLAYRRNSSSEITTTIEAAASFVNIPHGGYCGWVEYGLPRFEGLKKYEQEYGTKPKIILRQNPPQYIVEYLNILGYDQEDIIEWSGQDTHVESLVVPTVATPEYAPDELVSELSDRDDNLRVMNPHAVEWTREEIVSRVTSGDYEFTKGPSEFSEKIYISRQDAEFRRVSNFEEVSSYLESEGFDICKFEEMSVAEQVLRCASADVIVGPHGAGLVNMIYADDANIIELFGERKRKSTYYTLANSLSHNYSFVLCSERTEGLVVPMEKLNNIIK